MECPETTKEMKTEVSSEVSLLSNSSFVPDEKHSSSFENSPMMDKEKLQRYSARSTDEFWDALSSNYDYLMDDGLIATCREASSDLSLDDEKEIPESCYWSFTQFIEQFKWLHDLLHNIQVEKGGENQRSDAKILEERQKIAYLCKLFNEQAFKLSQRYPDMRDEVNRHLNRLNNKWKAVEQCFNPCKVKSPSKDCVFNEIRNRMKNLRKWLKSIEHRLLPVSLSVNCTQENLEKRYKEQLELQKEIQSQGKCFSLLLKLCEHLKGNVNVGQNSLLVWDAEKVRQVAVNLEYRWHTVWLKSLECQYMLEGLLQDCSELTAKLDKSFSGEPQKKHPRLGDAADAELLLLEEEIKGEMNFRRENLTDGEENPLCDDSEMQARFPAEKLVSHNDKGSIETVVPAAPEEAGVSQSDRGTSESASAVRLRRKKSSRDRPWSVTDVQQTFLPPAVPHSISESALDALCSAQAGLSKFCNAVKSPSCPKNEALSSKESENSGALLEMKMLPSLLNIIEDKTEKLSLNGSSSLVETSAVSETERCESVTQVEDHGSISWDEYQASPYLSETYSEQNVDEDEVKKLINFGDDYRAMLGSYSDASSASLKAPKSFKSRSKTSWHKGSSRESHDSLMSDSDSEDFNHMMRTSNHSLQFVMNALKENRDGKSYSEFAELLATCQTNLSQLHAVHQELVTGSELEALSKDDILRLQELIKAWEALQVEILKLRPKTEEMEATIIDVHCCLASLKEKLDMMALNAVKAGERTGCLSQVKSSIQDLQGGLSYLQDMKEAVLEVTSRILKLIQKKEHPSVPSLRDTATKLYQQWEDVYELNCSQLTKLQGLQSHWYEETETATNSTTESPLSWQSVQVGDSLPKPKVSSEELFLSTAAEIQEADVHNTLLQIKSNHREGATCCRVEDVPGKIKDPSCIMVSAAIKTKKGQENHVVNPHSKMDTPTRRSTFWRTMRASVPIQFALATLFYLSSLMDPNCCESINNFDSSFFLHLSFPGGQPPV